MGLYGNIIYGSGATYGQPASLPFSVEPLAASAVWYDRINVTWVPSDSLFTAFRLVRNQDNFPESPEDGRILINWVEDSADDLPTSYIDGTTTDAFGQVTGVPLVPGKYVYYRVWLLDDRGIWVVAGETLVLLPAKHNSDSISRQTFHEKMVGLLPRQFTSASESPNSEIDFDSELSAFLEGFSFTYDELLTYLDLLHPTIWGEFNSPATLYLQGSQIGVTPELGTVSRQQKILVREAIKTYQQKGTLSGLATFAESTTGFAPTVTTSPNLLLSMEDSTFYKGTGNWVTVGACTLDTDTLVTIPTDSGNAIDTSYVGKVSIDAANAAISNGRLSPITLGVPVTAGSDYDFSFWAKTESSTNTITPKVIWFNHRGEKLTEQSGTALSAATNWQKSTNTFSAPGYSATISKYEIASNVMTITLNSAHPFAINDEILISDAAEGIAGVHTVTAVTSTTVSFAYVESDGEISDVGGFVTAADWSFDTSASYAALELVFGNSGTVYLDMLQVTKGTVDQFYEARSVDVYLAPSKINYLENPSFLSTGAAWTTSGGTSSYQPTLVKGVYGGLQMLKLVPTNPGTATISTEVTSGLSTDSFYSFSIYGYSYGDPVTGTLTMTATNQTDSSVIVTKEVDVTFSSIWSRPSVSFYVPASTADLAISVELAFTNTEDSIAVDCAQLESSLNARDYIDGEMPELYYTGWYGTAHESASYSYTNKDFGISRLVGDIESYIPVGSAYRVLTEFGVEHENITY